MSDSLPDATIVWSQAVKYSLDEALRVITDDCREAVNLGWRVTFVEMATQPHGVRSIYTIRILVDRA